MTIVGVNPRGFTGPKTVQVSPEVFAPMAMEPLLVTRPWTGSLLTNPQKWWMQIMAQTKPGASDAAAQAELDAALRAAVLATMRPKAGKEMPRLVLADGSRGLNGAGRELARPLHVLLALVGLVLLLGSSLRITDLQPSATTRLTTRVVWPRAMPPSSCIRTPAARK